MITMGKRCTGSHALQIGAVQKIADPDQLLDAGIQFARELLTQGTYDRVAMKDMKEALYSDLRQKTSLADYIAPYFLQPKL